MSRVPRLSFIRKKINNDLYRVTQCYDVSNVKSGWYDIYMEIDFVQTAIESFITDNVYIFLLLTQSHVI